MCGALITNQYGQYGQLMRQEMERGHKPTMEIGHSNIFSIVLVWVIQVDLWKSNIMKGVTKKVKH